MKKSFLILTSCVLLSGCASLMPGFSHMVAVNIGSSKKEVISSVSHVLNEPDANYYIFEGTDDEIEILGYTFFIDSNIYFCFYNDRLFQAILMPRDSKEELEFRPDFKNPEIGPKFPRGYLISLRGQTGKMTTYY